VAAHWAAPDAKMSLDFLCKERYGKFLTKINKEMFSSSGALCPSPNEPCLHFGRSERQVLNDKKKTVLHNSFLSKK
jgi:hypothetical protein